MSKIINQSVENFIKELHLRINLLNSNTTRANLNEDAYNRLMQIINSYTQGNPLSLTITDLVKFAVKDIREILMIIGLDENSISKYTKDFYLNAEIFKNTYDETKLIEITEFFEEVRKIIINYLSEYQSINKNQNAAFGKTTEEYSRYIKLFEEQDFSSLFEDFDSLMKLMNNLAIPTEDKWQILEYIAKQNLTFENRTIVDINLAKKVYDIVSTYLVDDEIVGVVRKSVENRGVDIDLIPQTSIDVALETAIPVETVQNIICAIVVDRLFDYYRQASINADDEEILESIQKMIEDVLEFHTKEENNTIKSARIIIEENQEFYNSHKENDEDILKYIDLSISEIVNEHISFDEAIALKTLPIIKTISETLDKIERISIDTEDYELCLGILSELINAYNALLAKRNQTEFKKNK